jgi:hypothetical protein
MKYLLTLFAILVFSSCGNDKRCGPVDSNSVVTYPQAQQPQQSCASEPQVGRWIETAGNGYRSQVIFQADCRAVIQVCDSQIWFTPRDASGLTTLKVLNSNNRLGCLPVGTYQCVYTRVGPGGLTQNCGNGVVYYQTYPNI